MQQQFLISLFLLLFGTVLFGQKETQFNENEDFSTIDTVIVSGMQRTRLQHCQKFVRCLQSPENALTLSRSAINEDVQTLRNMNLFAAADYRIETDSTGREILYIDVEEKLYWLPIIGVDLSRENLRFTLGAFAYNLFGNGTTFRMAWHYYDRHSFEISLGNPYLFNKNWGASLELARWQTLEPTQVSENSGYRNENDFEVTKLNIGGLISYSPKFRNTIYLGANYLDERYLELITETNLPVEGIDFTTPKWLFKLGWDWDQIDYFFHYRSGFRISTGFETVYTEAFNDWFWKWEINARYFKRIGKIHNLASRLFIGDSTNDPMPFPAFVQDNYVNVRGAGNRVGRGTAEITANFEWRTTLKDWEVAAIQAVAFTDASTLRPIAGKRFEFLTEELTRLSVGGGFRLSVAKFYHGSLRIDYGVDVLDTKRHGFVIGLGSFF